MIHIIKGFDCRSENIWQSLVAYLEIIVTSENIGKERAYGTTFYALGFFKTREEYLQFLEAQDIANTTFESARKLSPVASEMYKDMIIHDADILETIRKMR